LNSKAITGKAGTNLTNCRPLRGLTNLFDDIPRVALRSTLGYTLAPAPQAGWLCFSEL
jgi:hypothetical protein